MALLELDTSGLFQHQLQCRCPKDSLQGYIHFVKEMHKLNLINGHIAFILTLSSKQSLVIGTNEKIISHFVLFQLKTGF